MVAYSRWVLKWTYTDMDGRVWHKQKELHPEDVMTGYGSPKEEYQRKVDANQYLMGGATITNVELYRVDVTETWVLS